MPRVEEVVAGLLDAFDKLRREVRNPIVYCTVSSVVANVSATIDYDGEPVTVPKARCFGCGSALPAAGELVAVHVNGTQISIIGRHL